MDFDFTDEQTMLRDSVRGWLADAHGFDARRRRIAGELPFDDWAGFAALGLAGLGVPEEAGGLGAAAEEMLIVAEEIGYALAPLPFVGSQVLAARLLDAFAETPEKAQLWADVATGTARLAAALDEKRARSNLSGIAATAHASGGGYVLDGHKVQAIGGDGATHFVVAARAEHGPALFLVPADAPGLERRSYDLVDDTRAGDLTLSGVAVPHAFAATAPVTVAETVALALDAAAVAASADAVGAMRRAIDLTADYMKTRIQFGQPLAEFQVLQHGVADLVIATELARSLVYRAAAALPAAAAERARAVSACKVAVMTAGKRVTGQAIHQHGGIGMTIEYPVGHCLRRLMVLETLLGDTEHHLARYVAAAKAGGYPNTH